MEADTVIGYQGKTHWCDGIMALYYEYFRGELERFMSSSVEYEIYIMHGWNLNIFFFASIT